MMKYFKSNNTVYAYDSEQLEQGYGKDMTPMTDEEIELHINPIRTDEQILGLKVAEALAYLVKTNHKFYIGYIPKEDDDLVAIQAKREEALLFIRDNK